MAKFEIRSKADGATVFSGRPASYAEFRNLLLDLHQAGEKDAAMFFIDRREVTFDDAMTAADQVEDARMAKRQETHRQIHWYEGVCGPLAANTHRTAWVRK